ncbi:hypothetical protein QYE76_019126 [Lolium multiflorum]|uniref:Transposase (putative) gypsy type domain-containing protein n=1 Tax=Lolium multiflorum TaxID=4521 RepID=A0AAD8VNS8_LOLMU|nr:hypothetical protein QYE76_019126 [Lolium multiflorum]
MGKKQIASCTAGDATSGMSRVVGWECSKFTKGDLRKVRQFGLLPAAAEVKFPGDETMPRPDEGWRVMFLAFLFRGLSVPAHEFLRGLLLVYGVQLHQLTPNSILHIACFITLCECFLGIHPHWGLWRHIFFIRRNAMKTAIHNVGGAIISIRLEAEYFDFKMAESVQNWRKKWFYIKDEKVKEQKFGLAPFDLKKSVKKLKSWDQPLTRAKLEETEPLMARIHTPQTDEDENIKGKRKRADDRKSESSSASKPKLAALIDSAAPTSDFLVFDMALGLSSDKEETPKDPADERTQESSAFTTTPSKMLSPQEKVVDSKRLERAEDPKRRPRRNSRSMMPPRPIAHEMMDMAIRHIRFRDEAKILKVALKRSQHRADELEAKLEAVGKALEEASARATAAAVDAAGIATAPESSFLVTVKHTSVGNPKRKA